MKNKIVKSEFGRNVLTLMTGTTIAQMIPLAFTPLLTRLFSPEEFGVFAFFMSIVTFLSVIGGGRYEMAIVLPKKDEDAINILALSVYILLGYTALLYLVYFIFRGAITRAIGIESLSSWIWMIPLAVFLTVAYRIFIFWSNRNKRFKNTSSAVISQATSRASVQILGGLSKFSALSSFNGLVEFLKAIFKKTYAIPTGISAFGVSALVLSYVVGFFGGVLFLLFPFFKNDRSLLSVVNSQKMKEMAMVHKKFPLINSWHALGDEFKNVGVTSTILFAFGDVLLGFYSMTFRILRSPLTIIGNSFSQVFYQKAAEMHANGKNFLNLVDKTVKKLALIAFPIFAVIIIFGPDLFALVLGDKWYVAGVYAQYLTPWLFISFVVSPVMQVGVILQKQGALLMFSLIGNLLIFASILAGAYLFDDILKGFILLSITQLIYFSILFLWVRTIAKVESGEITA